MSKTEEEFKDPFDVLYELGLLIFADDAPDFPEVISTWGKEPGRHGVLKGMTMPELPTHVHHWVFGALLMSASAIGKVWFALDSAKRASEMLQPKV